MSSVCLEEVFVRLHLGQPFREIDISPIKHLTNWRLELAAARLLDPNDPIAEIAESVGYDSESSLNCAFI